MKDRTPQLFAVVSWGRAATRWIAKVLDSHPDIYCVHAGNWGKVLDGERLDGAPYLRIIANEGSSHLAAGDVHGVSRHHIPEMRRSFGKKFNAAVVVREPIARLRSTFAFFEEVQTPETWNIRYVDGLISSGRVAVPADTFRCKFFVHASNLLNAILPEREVGRIFRSEDLTRSKQALGEFVKEITRGKVSPTAGWLDSALEIERINEDALQREHGQLSDWQIEVVLKVVEPRAWEMYQSLGYPPPRFVHRA